MVKGKKKKGGKKSEIDTTANCFSTKWDGQNQLSIGTRIEWTGLLTIYHLISVLEQ